MICLNEVTPIRSGVTTSRRKIRTAKYDFESINEIGALLRKEFTNTLKTELILMSSKKKEKSANPSNDLQKICKKYAAGIYIACCISFTWRELDYITVELYKFLNQKKLCE